MRTTILRSLSIVIMAMGLWLLPRTRAYAQPASSYSVAYSTGATLIAQTSPVSLLTAPNDDAVATTSQAIGFNFSFEGVTYTHLVVGPDGFVKLGTSSAVTAINDFSNSIAAPDNFPILFPWWDDLALGGSGLGGYVNYSLEGTSPNRKCVIEWFVTIPRNTTGTPNTKFQLVLNETTNTIQFIYGGTNTSTFETASAGIIGATPSSYISLTPSTTSFSSTTPNDNNSTYPATGTMVTFTPPAPCTGTPPAGTAVVGPASICPGTAFSITWNGGATAVGGLSYQLQTSSTGVPASYTNSGAAQTSPTFAVTGITATTYYRIVVTCTSTGGGVVTSVADTVAINPVTLCYCNANLGGFCGAGNASIDNFSFNTLSNLNNGCSATGPNGSAYTVFPPTGTNTTTLVIGTPYTVTIGTNAAAITSVWIDYNQDGQWTAAEHTQVNLNSSNGTATITIPTTALPGTTGMRVRSRLTGNPNGPGDACIYMGSGETEDYIVTLVAPVPCSGAPLAGTANTSNASPCPGTQVNITLSGGTIATGITFQLQSSTTSATTGFSNVTGASNSTGIFTQTPLAGNTWYRIVSTCGNTPGGTATSTSVQVTGQGAITTLPWNDGLESVTTTGANFPQCWKRINGDWETRDAGWWFYNDPRTGIRYLTNSVNGAQNEWIMTPGFQLTAGTSYDFSFYWVGDGFSGWTGHVGVNNIQDSTAATILGAPFVTATQTTSANTAYQQVIRTFVPATTGTYFFGVRVGDNFNGSNLGFDDFRVNISPTCPQPNVLPVTAITATGATLNWTPAATAPALGYQYEVRTSGAPGSGATGLVLGPTIVANTVTSPSVTGLTGTTSYTVYVRAICSPGDSSFWSSTTFTTTLDCTTATVITGCGQSQTFTVGTTGAYNPIQTPTGTGPFGTPGGEKLYIYTAPVTGTYTLDVSNTVNFTYVDYFFKPVTSGCGNTNWTYIDDVNGPTGVPNFVTFNLTAGTQYYFLADNESNTSTATQTFAINCPPTCGAPTNVNVVTTTTGASVSWTQNPPGTPTMWQISVAPQGSPASAGVFTIANANPFTVSGLTPSTPYSFYVRAICGPGDTSQWSAVFNTSTQCLAASLPFTENFSNLNFNFPPTCWDLAQGQATSTPSTLVMGYSNWFEDDYLNASGTGIGSAKVNLYGTFPQREWLISPSINLGPTPGNFQVEFNFGIVAWPSTTPAALDADDTLALIISTDNGATWSLTNALQIWTAANTPVNTTTGGQRFYIPMNGYSGTIKLGWYGTNGTTANADNDIFVDSVRIISTCTPLNVTLGNDSTVCGNASSLVLSAPAGGAGTTYAWSNSFNSATATTQTYDAAPVLNALNASPNNLVNVVTFFSTVTVGPGCSKSDTINVAVTYTPRVSSITSTLTGLNQYTFAPVGDSFATGYVWIFGDGGVAATPSATHTYTTPGTYNACLVVTNPCGNDTICTTVTITLGVNDVLADGSTVNIFPNPTAADAVLEVKGGAALRSYQVMSATGALVQERTIKGKGVTSTMLNTGMLAPGIYTLRIQLDKGVVVRKLEVIK